MQRFYWVIQDRLAGCSRPGAHGASVRDDLAVLRDHGIGAVVTLTETPVAAHELEAAGLETLHLPVDDFHAPTTQQMLQALSFIDDAFAEHLPVAVHCLAGQGRTGVVLLVTIGTGLGTSLFTDGVLLPNTELGHIEIECEDAELMASAAARKRDDLSWKQWGKQFNTYLKNLEALIWPDLIILGGGVSAKHDKFLPYLTVQAEIVIAETFNEAGIIGAALAGKP